MLHSLRFFPAMELKYTGTEDMTADVFTKALFAPKHKARMSLLEILVEDS